jgi:hypothetical protein
MRGACDIPIKGIGNVIFGHTSLAAHTARMTQCKRKWSLNSIESKPQKKDVQDDPRTQRTDANVDRVWTLVCLDQRLGVRLIAENWIWIGKQCDRLLQRIWEWEKCPQRWCLESWHMTTNIGFTSHLIFYTMQRCLIGSVLVMKRVFNTTQKQNARAFSGKQNSPWLKKARMSRSSRPCLCVSSVTRGSSPCIHCTRTNNEPTVLFGSADKVTGICWEEKTQTLAWQVDSPPWQCPCAWCIKSLRVLSKISITNMEHPLYSPDIAHCNFWLFPKLKNALTGQRFADIPDIQCNMILLWGIPENDFQDCLQQWHRHLTRRVFQRR